MKIDTFVLGAYQTNSYVLRPNETAKQCVVVDTGLSVQALIDFLEDHDLTPEALILTHGHGDHIAGVPELVRLWPRMQVYVHQAEVDLLKDPALNLSMMTGTPMKLVCPMTLVGQGDVINHVRIQLTVLHTPGHTQGGMSLYCQKAGVVFVGDTLFAESIGRTDFPGGSETILLQGIRSQLFTLPEETVVYPGHGCSTTIGHEKAFNPFTR